MGYGIEPDSMSPVSQGIFVARTPRAFYVRIVGRGSSRNSGCLRAYGEQRAQEGCDNIYFDVCRCEMMDSTFLGVLAGFALALPASGQLVLAGLSEDNRRAFRDLGLDQIDRVHVRPGDSIPVEFPPETEFHFLAGSDGAIADRAGDLLDQALLMLECHENLCRVDGRNENKFRDVKQFLREDIARHRPPDQAK
jgi:anti-sigma B factor antagonist